MKLWSLHGLHTVEIIDEGESVSKMNLIEQVKQIKEYTDKTINVPFPYILLGIDIFLLFNTEYISLIDASKWVPNNIREVMLKLANTIYANAIVLLIIFAIILFVLVIASYTPVFEFLHKKDYMDRTTTSWNEYSAIRKILKVMIQVVTSWWIYYFSINILFNQHNFANNFPLLKGENLLQISKNNELVSTGYISAINLEFMNILFWLNAFIAAVWVIKALFVIRIPTKKYYIKFNELNSYIIINSFEASVGINKVEIILLKEKYFNSPKYLVVKLEDIKSSRIEGQDNNYAPMNKRSYEILDSSDNLSDVKYHFESLKDKQIESY